MHRDAIISFFEENGYRSQDHSILHKGMTYSFSFDKECFRGIGHIAELKPDESHVRFRMLWYKQNGISALQYVNFEIKHYIKKNTKTKSVIKAVSLISKKFHAVSSIMNSCLNLDKNKFSLEISLYHSAKCDINGKVFLFSRELGRPILEIDEKLRVYYGDGLHSSINFDLNKVVSEYI